MAGRISIPNWTKSKSTTTNTVFNIVNSSEERRSLDITLSVDGNQRVDTLLKSGRPVKSELMLGVGEHQLNVRSIEAGIRESHLLTVTDSTKRHEVSVFYRETSADFVERENKRYIETLLRKKKHARENSKTLRPEQKKAFFLQDSIDVVEAVNKNPKYSFEKQTFEFKTRVVE